MHFTARKSSKIRSMRCTQNQILFSRLLNAFVCVCVCFLYRMRYTLRAKKSKIYKHTHLHLSTDAFKILPFFENRQTINKTEREKKSSNSLGKKAYLKILRIQQIKIYRSVHLFVNDKKAMKKELS